MPLSSGMFQSRISRSKVWRRSSASRRFGAGEAGAVIAGRPQKGGDQRVVAVVVVEQGDFHALT
jgi:hypothetical protein